MKDFLGGLLLGLVIIQLLVISYRLDKVLEILVGY